MQARQGAARAYYSVLHLLREQLMRPGEVPSRDTHGLVKSILIDAANKSDPDEYVVHALKCWKTLIDNRERADYNLKMDFGRHLGDVSLVHAKKVFTLFDQR